MAELKVHLIILLAEHGYPPVGRDEIYKDIFEQAENFKKYPSYRSTMDRLYESQDCLHSKGNDERAWQKA